MSKSSADQEISKLKSQNWILQEQLNRLEKDFYAFKSFVESDLKERVIVTETFLRVKHPGSFPVVDRSMSSFPRPTQFSLDHRAHPSRTGGSSQVNRDSQPSRILGIGGSSSGSILSEDDDDRQGDDEDDDDEIQNGSRRRNERDTGAKAYANLTAKCDEKSLEAVANPNAKVTKWLNTQNIEVNTDRPTASTPKSSKRPKMARDKVEKEEPPKKKKPSTKRSSIGSVPIGKCMVMENGAPCKTQARKGCDVCGMFVCSKHRYTNINCPDYMDALKDCYKDFEKRTHGMESAHLDDLISDTKQDKDKEGVGRCAYCIGGKKRKVSRTRCQTCWRFICADHQVKTIRCSEHRHHTLSGGGLGLGLDSDYETSSINSSPRPDIIDHIDAI